MNTTKLSRFARESAGTGSAEKKSEMEELLISRDTPRFADGVLSMLFGINLATGSILKSQEVLLDKIESIAQKVTTLEKEVQSLKEQLMPVNPAMNSQLLSPINLDQATMDYVNSLQNMLELGTSQDITCYETL